MKYALITEDQISAINAAMPYIWENPEQLEAIQTAKRILMNLKMSLSFTELKGSNHEQ